MEGYSCELPICRNGSRPARCFEESTCLKLIGDGGRFEALGYVQYLFDG